MALLWPELDEHSARNNLKQTVFAIRHALGVARVFDRSESNLRVDRELISADVYQFEHALATGAYEEAVRLYTSPFLDGFHLAHAPDFDRWTERVRSRLAWGYVRALESLATNARLRGDSAAHVRWCRQLAEHDPASTTYALSLLGALTDVGEQLAALEHVRAYTRLLREEFDSEPDERIVAAGERLLQRVADATRRADGPAALKRAATSPFTLPSANREVRRQG